MELVPTVNVGALVLLPVDDLVEFLENKEKEDRLVGVAMTGSEGSVVEVLKTPTDGCCCCSVTDPGWILDTAVEEAVEPLLGIGPLFVPLLVVLVVNSCTDEADEAGTLASCCSELVVVENRSMLLGASISLDLLRSY